MPLKPFLDFDLTYPGTDRCPPDVAQAIWKARADLAEGPSPAAEQVLMDAARSESESVQAEVLRGRGAPGVVEGFTPYLLWLVSQGVADAEGVMQDRGLNKIRDFPDYVRVHAQTWEALTGLLAERSRTSPLPITPLGAWLYAIRQELFENVTADADPDAPDFSDSLSFPHALPRSVSALPMGAAMEEVEQKLAAWIRTLPVSTDFLPLLQTDGNGKPVLGPAWIHPLVMRNSPLVATRDGAISLAYFWRHGGALAALDNPALGPETPSAFLEYAVRAIGMDGDSHDPVSLLDALRAKGVMMTPAHLEGLYIAEMTDNGIGGSLNSVIYLSKIREACSHPLLRQRLWDRYPGNRGYMLLNTSGPVWADLAARSAEGDGYGRTVLAKAMEKVSDWQLEGITPSDVATLMACQAPDVRSAALRLASRLSDLSRPQRHEASPPAKVSVPPRRQGR